MIPSRPNGVLNHGTPAYGYGPYGVLETSMRRSGRRAAHPPVEALARGFDQGVLSARSLARPGDCRLRDFVRHRRHRSLLSLASNRDRQRDWRARRQVVLEPYDTRRSGCGRVAPLEDRPAFFAIESAVAQTHGRITKQRLEPRAPRSRGVPRTSKMSAKSASTSNVKLTCTGPRL